MLHPGYLRTQLSQDQYQVHWLSWVSAWVHLDTALGAMTERTACITDRDSLLSRFFEGVRTKLRSSGFFEQFTAVKKYMAAGIPGLVKFVSTMDSARVPEDEPVTGHGSVHWTAGELTTLENLMKFGKSNDYIAERVGRSSGAVARKRQRYTMNKDQNTSPTSSSVVIPWRCSSTEIATLRTLKEPNRSNEEIARLLNRTRRGVGPVSFRLQKEDTASQQSDS